MPRGLAPFPNLAVHFLLVALEPDAVERGEVQAGLVHHTRDQRHHGFGVPSDHGQRLARDHCDMARVEHGGRAGRKRGVDGKNTHLGIAVSNQVSDIRFVRARLSLRPLIPGDRIPAYW